MKTLVFLAVLAFGKSVKLPSAFPKCKLQDPNLSGCLLKSINTILPLLTKPYEELNLPNLDPLFIPDVVKDGAINFTEPFKTGKIYGLTGARIRAFEFDFDKKTIALEALFPRIRIIGQHNFNNKILVLPFIGAGTGKTTLKNLDVSVIFLFDEVRSEGKTYIKVVSGSLDMEPGSVNFGFENLHDSDQAFVDKVNALLSANSKTGYSQFESEYNENFLNVFKMVFNNFFEKVSLEEAFN